MIINSSFVSRKTGLTWPIKYEELDSFDSVRHLAYKPKGCAVAALCFCEDKLVLVYAHKRRSWEMPGGGLEDETLEQGIEREIREESNMRVLELFPLGYDTLTDPQNGNILYQYRFAARVEPIGPFVADAAAEVDITDMKCIDPKEYKKYFDWGERGDAMMNKARKLLGITS